MESKISAMEYSESINSYFFLLTAIIRAKISIKVLEIGNLLTKIEGGSSSMPAVLATIWNSGSIKDYQDPEILFAIVSE